MSFEGHVRAVTCIRFSPDGRTLLTASADSAAKLWSIESYQCLHTLAGFQEDIPIYTAEFSADGTHAVLSQRFGDVQGEIPGVTVWRTQDGKRMRSLYVEGGMVGHGATWSPAGDLIATNSGECNAWVFCAQTGVALQHLDHEGWADCMGVGFSPDGRFLWSRAGECVFIRLSSDMWASNLADDGSVTGDSPILLKSTSYQVDLSSAGLCALAAAYDDDNDDGALRTEVSIVDLDNGQEIIWTRPVDSRVVSSTFAPHGSTLMVLTRNEPPCLWNATDGASLRTFGAHPSSSVTWSPDGTLAAFLDPQEGGRISVWSIEDGCCVHTFEEVAEVTCVSFW